MVEGGGGSLFELDDISVLGRLAVAEKMKVFTFYDSPVVEETYLRADVIAGE